MLYSTFLISSQKVAAPLSLQKAAGHDRFR
jgi:hypothetical protein